jgi:hypothetical protein
MDNDRRLFFRRLLLDAGTHGAIVQKVDATHPQLLRTNTHATDAEFLYRCCQALNAPGETWGLLSKSGGANDGENGYLWPNGVKTSHDAICKQQTGERVDIIGGAGDGNPASPSWGEVPRHEWRASNVYVPLSAVPAPGATDPGKPPPPPPPPPTLPWDRAEMMHEWQWLHAYYAAPEGLQRPQGLSINGGPDWEGVGAWTDVYQKARFAGKSRAEARAEYVKQIRQSEEWRSKHPGETP